MGTREHGLVVWIEGLDVAVTPADGRMGSWIVLPGSEKHYVSFRDPLVANTFALPFLAAVTICKGSLGCDFHLLPL